MTNEKIKKILYTHGIEYLERDEKIYAVTAYTLDGRFFTELENVTGYSKKQILDYLGY